MVKTSLEGADALNLWRRGKGAWNAWMEKNPVADIDFSSADFSEERGPDGNTAIDFSLYNFPNGTVSFRFASFGKGDVDFTSATFGKGDVDFSHAIFGDGDISFFRVNFGPGDVHFAEVFFGQGNVDFSGAIFGDGEVNFFGSTLGKGNYKFFKTRFDGSINLWSIKGAEMVENLSFCYASFGGNLSLSNVSLNCVIDLTNTKVTNQITLHNLVCNLRRRSGGLRTLWLRKAIDPEDAPRLRRLKELAESNRDHEKALEFHADEMRAKRWHDYNLAASLLDFAFSALSDYGRSIWRPSVGLVLMITFLSFGHGIYSEGKWLAAVEYTVAGSLPFISSADAIREASLDVLYGACPPEFLSMLILGQGAATVIFLFLIGLGLRNRFRI